MTSWFRMMTTLTAAILIMIGVFFIFFNTSLDDQRSTALRQVVTVNLNKKANRDLPEQGTIATKNQTVAAHYSLARTDHTRNDKWTVNGDVYAFEEGVWEQLYSQFGDKIGLDITSKDPVKSSDPTYQVTTRSRTWSYNGNRKGTLIFSYLYQNDLNDVYAVKVQAMIDGKSYSTNLAVIHDFNHNNYGLYTNAQPLTTAKGVLNTNAHKSGANKTQTYTTDNGYIIGWYSEFATKPIYGMDHIDIRYDFDQEGEAVTMLKSLSQVNGLYEKIGSNAPIIITSNSLDPSIRGALIDPKDTNQIEVHNNPNNGASNVVIHLNAEQSKQLVNLAFNNAEKVGVNAYTQVNNTNVSTDYASAKAQMTIWDKNNNVLQTLTSDEQKVRISPFAIQPIETGMSINSAKVALLHYVNKLYPATTDITERNANNGIAEAQLSFAKSGNVLNTNN